MNQYYSETARKALARKIAAESMVLLENKNSGLPLAQGFAAFSDVPVTTQISAAPAPVTPEGTSLFPLSLLSVWKQGYSRLTHLTTTMRIYFPKSIKRIRSLSFLPPELIWSQAE